MNNIRKFLLTAVILQALLLLIPKDTGCQTWLRDFVKGYLRPLRGGGFEYHSLQPDITTSLLVRSEDSARYIEWETDTVPYNAASPVVNFIWMFGIDANPDKHDFRLLLNDTYCLTFSNPGVSEIRSWVVRGLNGVSLNFRPTMLDKYNDPMGYAILSVPSSFLVRGKPQKIRISGESAGKRVWYMTFQYGVEEKYKAYQLDAILRGPGNKPFRRLVLELVHLGDSVKSSVEETNGRRTPFILVPGFNRLNLDIPDDTAVSEWVLKLKFGDKEAEPLRVKLRPVRQWKLFFVQHTHTDIGYTRPQTEILPEHLRYIDYALDYCDQTDSMPDGSKFRWTCETSWAVSEYLKTRPAARLERLKKRAAEGRIELTALYLNSSDLADEATIAATLQAVKFFRESGFPVKTAMQDDINGIPWCLADMLSGAGIEFLNMGQNTDRALRPFSRPTTFWWESPSGKRLLVNRPEHYMYGNNLGILNSTATLEKNLFPHLQEIAARAYPFNEYAIQFSGYFTDNSPPSSTACNIVKEWNETYIWPEIRLATVSEFLETVKTLHSGEFPVIRGAWPDWWIDGFGSAALTTAYTRMAHADYIANNGLMTMSAILGEKLSPHVFALYQQVTSDLAFYDEHTFGAAESISDPLCENSIVQIGEKLSYTWEAVKKNRILREEVMGCLQSHLPLISVPSVSVFNTLGSERSSEVNIFIDHQVIPRNRQFRILTPGGKEMKMQSWSEREDGSYYTLFAEKIPAMGFSSFRILASPLPAVVNKPLKFTAVFENQWYSLKLDTASGRIISVTDRELQRELADTSSEYGFGEPVYETLGTNRAQLSLLRLEEYKRTTWENVTVSGILTGSVWNSITLTGKIPGCATPQGIRCEIRLYNTEKKLEFRYSMKKLPVRDPEGLYISFPFRFRNARVFYEVAGASVEAGREQINGSATDWQGIQNFIAIRDDSCQLNFVSPEIPIVQLGDINLGEFSPVVKKPEPVIYSWVLNNYWTTNFLASQEGELKWTYQITSTAERSLGNAATFGWSQRIPLLARVIPGSKSDEPLSPVSCIKELPANLLLVNSLPGDDLHSVVLHVRETAGKTAEFDPLSVVTPSSGNKNAEEVNVLGEAVCRLKGKCFLRPFETKFVKISWKD